MTSRVPAIRRAASAVASPRSSEREPAKRKPRTPWRVPCRIRLVDPQSGQVRSVVGEMVNLSCGGAALQAAIDAPVGTWVETLVPTPNGDPRFLCGRVVHSRRTLAMNFELGIQIIEDQPPAF